MQNRPKDLAKAVEETLLRRMESGEYAPGNRLPTEADLAIGLGVSRATIREGVRHLSSLGVIEIVRGAQGGMFMRQPDSSIVMEAMTMLLRLKTVSLNSLMETRRALPPAIASLAAEQATASDIELLEGHCQKIEAGLEADDFEIETLLAFHNHLVIMTGNELLVSLVQPLNEIAASFLRRFWRMSLHAEIASAFSRHRELIETLRRADGDGAQAAMLSLMKATP